MRRWGPWFVAELAIALMLVVSDTPGSGRPSALGAEPVVIRAITAWPLDCNCVTQYKRYIDEINKRGKGKIEIKLLGGPEVVKPFEQLQALRTGIADMTHSAADYYVGETIEGAALTMLDP